MRGIELKEPGELISCDMFITMDVSPISQEVKGARPTDSHEDPESANSE